MIALLLALLVVIGLAVNGLRLRKRIPAALTPSGASSGWSGASSGWSGDGGYSWITSRPTSLDDATRRDAVAYARAQDLDLVEVIPAGLPVTAARDLVRQVDPRAYRADPRAAGCGAGAAVLMAPDLLKLADVGESDAAGPAGPAGPAQPAEPADVIELTRRMRPYAVHGVAIVTAPRLQAGGDDPAKRRARLRAAGVFVPGHLVLDAVPYALTVVALVTAWPWGLAAAAAYCLQPYLIFTGTAVRPRGLHAAALLRPVHDPYVWTRTAAGRWRSAAERQRDAERTAATAYYQAALARGTARFFEERRPDCPWCGSGDLAVLLCSPDLVMHKPGMFTLERCGGCEHVFQNPRLTPDGLSFYYRDAYDGLGTATAEAIFLTAVASYRARARMLEPFTTPKSWLDVGTGHAHFCATAREIWPETVFDGLDQGAGMADAERRGWIDTAHRGMFPELAGELAGRYDVVSMHHYLEHTREPFAELDAAARLLPPGGYLLIELPDPQWRLARLFRRYWMAWFQPQHLHMMPIGNLTSALTERGLRPVAVERAQAHQANDAVMAAYLFFANLAPDRSMPWSARPPTTATRLWRSLAWTVGIPAVVAGLMLDRTAGRALARHWDRGNAYRVLARREEGNPGAG
ncbi:MAG TPA: class I SAM-dependent methyltransferase [Streptosporangiaceae bacterium]